MGMQYFADPTPHIVLDQLVDPAVYRQARFPDLPKRPGGRIGRYLYPGEAGYDELIQTAGWRDIYARFTSQAFVSEVLGHFAADMRKNGCAVDPDAAYLDPYKESREETERSPLSKDHPPDALFNRFDFQATDATYGKGVHVDWPRRVVGGVLFFCSAEEERMTGGTFALFEDEGFAGDRVCHQPKLRKEFVARHNTGVLFLNSNTGFHGPTRIKSIAGLRKWIYYSISSRRDVWPFKVTAVGKTGHFETKLKDDAAAA